MLIHNDDDDDDDSDDDSNDDDDDEDDSDELDDEDGISSMYACLPVPDPMAPRKSASTVSRPISQS